VPSLALIILWCLYSALTQIQLDGDLCSSDFGAQHHRLQSINPAILEAARGMGMNPWQRWWRVQVPSYLFFLAGLRLAAIVGIAIATISEVWCGWTGRTAV